MVEELERTYLAKEIPVDLRQFPSKEMADLYIPVSFAHPVLRIRKNGEKYEITKKQPIVQGDASRQSEETIPLSEEEYIALISIPGKQVLKTRYFYTLEGIAFEVDIFRGFLAGLILIDVEFPSKEAMTNFSAPGFCLVEVTQEKFVAGGELAGKKYADIEKIFNNFDISLCRSKCVL